MKIPAWYEDWNQIFNSARCALDAEATYCITVDGVAVEWTGKEILETANIIKQVIDAIDKDDFHRAIPMIDWIEAAVDEKYRMAS